MFMFVDSSAKGLSTLEMPRESSSAPTLEAGVPETSSHSSISSKGSRTLVSELYLLHCFHFSHSWSFVFLFFLMWWLSR